MLIDEKISKIVKVLKKVGIDNKDVILYPEEDEPGIIGHTTEGKWVISKTKGRDFEDWLDYLETTLRMNQRILKSGLKIQ